MVYQLRISPKAWQQLEAAPEGIWQRIREALERVATDRTSADAPTGAFELEGYRVSYAVDEACETLELTGIAHA
jgi:hypothetical protein